MEFYEIKRVNSDEEQEEDKEEEMRDMEGNPSYYSSSSYSSSNHHQSRQCLGASFDVWGEDGSRSYHGAAISATKIQELDLMDSVPPPPPPPNRFTDQSCQLIDRSSDVGGGGSSSFSMLEKEHMFHKVVTPSDVGKLNRLVIPKQHAEKYFPLDYDQLKGLLLNFEDRNGKEWRFRYSYWNSSQSYVMTKGWSRFVKDKKLDAGDIVLFDRGIGETGKDRLFIDWRHRTLPDTSHHLINAPSRLQWGRLIYPMPPSQSTPMPMLRPDYFYHHPHQNHQNQWDGSSSSSSGIHDYGAMNLGRIGGAQEMGGMIRTRVMNSVPVTHNSAVVVAPKRLRLFGVNMDCSSTPQENNETVVLPSVPLLVTTASTAFSSSLGLPLPQSRQYDGSPMPNLQPESRGKGYRRYDMDI